MKGAPTRTLRFAIIGAAVTLCAGCGGKGPVESQRSHTGGQADIAMLKPGPGFDGPTAEPGPIGSGAGSTAKVIARWDVVPYQRFEGQFDIGVIAFHINGIDRVEFSVDGGPWATVTRMSLNTRTNVWEYVGRLDATDFRRGLVEIRARVYPKSGGIARVLQGPITRGMAYENGNHSLFLYADPRGELAGRELVVDAVNGSDTSGDGTFSKPFQTIVAALEQWSQSNSTIDGVRILCLPGSYSIQGPTMPLFSADRTWPVVTTAPGVKRNEVVLNGVVSLRARLIEIENITVQGRDLLRGGVTDSYIWVNRCRLVGPGRTIDSGFFSPVWWSGLYFTDSEVSSNRNGIRSADFIRGCWVHDVSGSPFGSSCFVVNSRVDRYDNSGTNFHGDVFHWFFRDNLHENAIVYNLEVYKFNSQGIFAEVFGGGNRFDNVAFVNVHISRDASGAAGSWWEVSTNHLLMWHVSFPDQLFRWAQGAYGTRLENVSIQGSLFKAFTKTKLPSDARIAHTHYVDTSVWGSWTAGTDVTSGDPQFTDPGTLDYHPRATSSLAGRVPAPPVPADCRGVPRGDPSAVGPFVAVGEAR